MTTPFDRDLHDDPAAAADRAPDFALPDHTGQTAVRLGRLLIESAPLLIVFIRGHWCPYCRRYLTKLQNHLPMFSDAGCRGVVAISPEPPATSAYLAGQLGLSFPILADVEGRVIEQFGVRNNFSAAQTLIPHAAVFLLDASAAIRFRSIDRNYKKRTSMRTILSAVAALNASARTTAGASPAASQPAAAAR